jgi:peroxiredoxin
MNEFGITTGTVLDASILYYIDENNLHKHLRVDDIFKDKVSVVFGGPAPFSKLDTEQAKLYEQASSELLSHNIDQVVGIYCQDAFVCKKFQEDVSKEIGTSNVKYYADGDGFFVRDYKLWLDFTFHGLSLRSWRWCAVVEDCQIIWVQNDEFQLIEHTHPKKVLEWLESL